MKVKKIIKRCDEYERLLIGDTDGVRELECFAYEVVIEYPPILEMEVQNIRSIRRKGHETLLLTGNFSEVMWYD